MSKREIERLALMQQIHERSLTQRKAAEISGLSLRWVRVYWASACRRAAPLTKALAASGT